MVNGPDGALWFLEANAMVGRLTTDLKFTEYSACAGRCDLYGITAAGGKLWIAEGHGGQILSMSTAGVVMDMRVPPTLGSGVFGITVGPDGNIWFTEGSTNKVGSMSLASVFGPELILSAASQPRGITPGPDGNLWFTEYLGNRIGRATPMGKINEASVPTANAGLSGGITSGPDGNVWFTEPTGNKVARVNLKKP